MNRIKFTSGTITALCAGYYTLVLLNGVEVVYSATIEELDCASIINKHYEKIKLIK